MGEDYSKDGHEATEKENQQATRSKRDLTDKLWYDEVHPFPIPKKVMDGIQFNAAIIGPQVHIKT